MQGQCLTGWAGRDYDRLTFNLKFPQAAYLVDLILKSKCRQHSCEGILQRTQGSAGPVRFMIVPGSSC